MLMLPIESWGMSVCILTRGKGYHIKYISSRRAGFEEWGLVERNIWVISLRKKQKKREETREF